MKNVTIITHPLIQQNLTRIRDKSTQPEEFRRALGEVAALMVYEATRTFATLPVTVQTPLERTRGVKLKHEVLLVPVLRAGLGMLDPILRCIPHARVGFIGLRIWAALKSSSWIRCWRRAAARCRRWT
jgi:uracil phosphoribosyltransferase